MEVGGRLSAMKKKHYFIYFGSVQLFSLFGLMSVHWSVELFIYDATSFQPIRDVRPFEIHLLVLLIRMLPVSFFLMVNHAPLFLSSSAFTFSVEQNNTAELGHKEFSGLAETFSHMCAWFNLSQHSQEQSFSSKILSPFPIVELIHFTPNCKKKTNQKFLSHSLHLGLEHLKSE